MTQALISINAMLIALTAALASGQLDSLFSAPVRAGIAIVVGIVLAGIGPLLPAVSETLRRTLSLQRRG